MAAPANTVPDFRRDFERVAPDVVRQAAQFQAAILADVAGRRGTLNGRITPVAPDMKCAGPALTVEVRPGDNLMIHAAMAIAKPGDVLVIDGKGDRTCALMGAIMINQCKAIGIAGVVMDAAARDLEELRQLGTALVGGNRIIERHLAGFHPPHERVQFVDEDDRRRLAFGALPRH